MRRVVRFTVLIAVAGMAMQPATGAPRKAKSVVLGGAHQEPYTQQGDPAGYEAGDETTLPVRALLVNGVFKEWTTGESHDVTDRSFVVREAIRMNNALPGDKKESWAWQRGPWLLVNRDTGRATAVRLRDYDPAVSEVSWFRDYAAYCGVTPSGKSLYAVVEQISARKAVLAKKLMSFDAEKHPRPACGPAEWQREPLRVTFHPAGMNAMAFDVGSGSAVLVEGSGGGAETPAAAHKGK
jgi:hypothetical protein